MLMEERLLKLEEYQAILTRRVAVEKEVHEIPKALDVQIELLTRIKRTYSEKAQAFSSAEARVRELRQLLAEAETTRESAEKQMDVIKTQREYEALNKEIRDATEHEHSYRKDLQREERDLAELEESLRREESMIQLQESEIAEKSQRINAEKDSKLAEILELTEQGTEVSEGIEKEILDKFERIIRSKANVGIVNIKGCVCTGCYMVLPAQFVNDVRQQNKIVFCPYCSRVLKYQETGDQDGDQIFIDIESGSLSDLEDYAEEGEDDSFDEDADDDEKDSPMDDSEN
jgi:hypothetical protein